MVIPARDAAGTIAHTLGSLLEQSDPDWEALVIDDGSIDETGRVARRFAERDHRFAVLEGTGAGAAAARNAGLARARGRRVLFLDSDDWIDGRFLELMNESLDAAPDARAVYCGDRRVMPDGRTAPVRSDPRVGAAPFEVFARTCALAIHAVLLERDTVERAGGFDTSLRTCEDWDLWQRVARLGGRWAHLDVPLSYYRLREDSLTRDIGQVLSDAAVVIRRGFSTDERVPDAHPDHRRGASPAEGRTAGLAYAFLALWCGAFDCGRGGAGTVATEKLAGLRIPLEHTAPIANLLLDGLVAGMRAVPEQLAARWPQFGARTTAWIAAVGRAWRDPVAARRMQYAIERLVLDYDDLAAPRPLSLTLGLRVDLRDPAPVTPPPGVDRLYAYLCEGAEVRALVDLGALATITTRQWLEIAASRVGWEETARIAGPSLGRSRGWNVLRHTLGEIGRAPREAIRPSGRRHLCAAAERKALLGAAGPRRTAGSHRWQVDRLRAQADRSASGPASRAGVATRRRTPPAGDRRSYWEALFEEPDPWHYGSAYEQEKYARQLEMLPDRPIGAAVELACAEGRFTEMLARRVDRLIAIDISAVALKRARRRCRSLKNVELRRLDLVTGRLPQPVDLLVCSEVLYYLDDEAELRRVAARLAGALRPGGHLLTAHAFVLNDEPARTGFDWESPWGATTINRVLTATPGLALERSLCTELYRIDRFVRRAGNEPPSPPAIEKAAITADLEPEVARRIVWGGAVARRAELAATQRHRRVPVLAYHRIADEGPGALNRYRVSPAMFEAQMTWLRRNGYHSIVSEELAWFIEHGHPFVGRPVMITFDDGFLDFSEHAWPILRAHDFRAEVFIVTDLVGGVAEWDRRHGEPAPLMDAATIAQLASEGVAFGSHLARHHAADGLSTRELAEELARSRACLAQWTGRPAESFAAPHGRSDERLRLLAAELGFRTGFSTEAGPARLEHDPLNLPRVGIQGDMSIGQFVKEMGASG